MDAIRKIFAIVAIVISFLAAFYFTTEYKSRGERVSVLEKENVTLVNTVKNQKNTYDANLEILRKEIKDANEASDLYRDKVKETNDLYERAKKDAIEKTNRYDTLIRDGWRLRDPFTDRTDSDRKDSGSGKGNDEEKTESITGGSDESTSKNGLSEGLSRYLITRAIEADQVAEQLIAVQGFATEQRHWILKYCNAVE